jgi:hypothetical protein
MASTNVAAVRIARHLDRTGKSPEQWGQEIGVSGMTVRRAMHSERPNRHSRVLIAAGLGENDATNLWPVALPGKRQPGGSRSPRSKAVA